jgi:hypothetical protein
MSLPPNTFDKTTLGRVRESKIKNFKNGRRRGKVSESKIKKIENKKWKRERG